MWRTDYWRLPRSHCADFHSNQGYPEALFNVLRKKAKLHAYRISMVHELKEPDQVKRVPYCQWFQIHLKENPGILDYTWFLAEAWFHLSGYVNSQNSHIWASEYPNMIHKEPHHSEKIGVWCGMSRWRIIGPIFFNATITTAAYMEIFNTFVKSIGRWGTLSWIFPAGWSDIPHFTRQHGWNSVLFRRPRHFEGTWATALARSDAAWLFLMGISERESLPKQTTNHRRLENKHHQRNSGSDSGHTGKDFPKYRVPGSILSGCKWWPLKVHVMMSHFLHNEVSPLQISLQYPH